MRALVIVASRHGGTREIARAIASELTAAGVPADTCDACDVGDLAGYGAVVLGSAVYMGHWLPEARGVVERCAPQLATLPVWLFSSGPLGAQAPQPADTPAQMTELARTLGARGAATFVGALDPHDLGLGERLLARAVHAPAGDFRDWHAIRAWAHVIAAELGAGG
jgi:menaquinone-dependent protoporphyrinogen oxidase